MMEAYPILNAALNSQEQIKTKIEIIIAAALLGLPFGDDIFNFLRQEEMITFQDLIFLAGKLVKNNEVINILHLHYRPCNEIPESLTERIRSHIMIYALVVTENGLFEWDIYPGKIKNLINQKNTLHSFSDDGTLVAYCTPDRKCYIYDVCRRKHLYDCDTKQLDVIHFSPNNDLMLVSDNSVLRIHHTTHVHDELRKYSWKHKIRKCITDGDRIFLLSEKKIFQLTEDLVQHSAYMFSERILTFRVINNKLVVLLNRRMQVINLATNGNILVTPVIDFVPDNLVHVDNYIVALTNKSKYVCFDLKTERFDSPKVFDDVDFYKSARNSQGYTCVRYKDGIVAGRITYSNKFIFLQHLDFKKLKPIEIKMVDYGNKDLLNAVKIEK